MAGKQRKKSLEEQHAGLIEKKRGLEMRAAEKNREAGEVEAQVRVSEDVAERAQREKERDLLIIAWLVIAQQIRAIHAATHAELDRGETAFKKIKDQVGALPRLRASLGAWVLHEVELPVADIPCLLFSATPSLRPAVSLVFTRPSSSSPCPAFSPSSALPFSPTSHRTEVYSLKVNKALDSINTLNAQPIDLGA